MSGRRRAGGGGGPGGAGGDAGGGGGSLGVTRNKRGTPMYSREDIREQYCINDKELHALEASRRKPIFGCLTSGNAQVSPCKKKSLLPACLRGRVPSDENVYTKTSSAAPSAHASPAHRKHQHEHDQIDYEDDSYFKRRPKTICYTDPKRLASFDDSLGRSSRVSRPRSEVGSATYDSYHADDASSDAARRPTQLAISSGDHHASEFYHGDLHKEGSGYPLTRSAFTQPNTPDLSRHSSRHRQVTTPALFPLEDRPQKHVSFQKAMSRSATVAGLEEQVMSRQDSGKASVKSGGSRSHERLLDGRRTPDYMEQRALDQLLAPVLTKALLQESGGEKHRKGQAREVTRRSGCLKVESEAGSRSRSTSRTPSLRRKKVEKKTVGVQTDEVFEAEEVEERMEVGRAPGVVEEARERNFGTQEEGTYGVGGRRQKKTKKKAITIVEPPDVFARKEEPLPPADQRKEEGGASSRELGSENKKQKRPKSKSTKAKAKDGTTSEVVQAPESKGAGRQVQRPRRGPEEVPFQPGNPKMEKSVKEKGSKVSMAMQTDTVETIFSDRSIFLTEDLDTSTDWREESSVDWQTSASSLAWQTDRSSFAWQTDASSGNKYTMDNSFALESCEEQENEQDLLNMDVLLIRDRRNKDSSRNNLNQNAAQESENETNQNVQWDGGGPRANNLKGEKAHRKTRQLQKDEGDGKQRLGDEKTSHIGNIEEKNKRIDVAQKGYKPRAPSPPGDEKDVREIHREFRENGKPNGKQDLQRWDKDMKINEYKEQVVSEEENDEAQDPEIDEETNAMVRRLRFRRQMAEEFLNQQAEDQGKTRGQVVQEPESRGHSSLASTLPNRKNQKLRFETEVVTPEKQSNTRESFGTWPQRLTENQRSDDINLKAFPAFAPSTATFARKSRNQPPEHKTSHLEINLVIRDKEENPKNMFMPERDGAGNVIRSTTVKAQPVETSDEYPRSDHDYGGSRPKKPSAKSESSRTPQRKKKSGLRELIESAVPNKWGKDEHEVQSRLPPKKQSEKGINRLTYIRDEEKQQCYCTDTSSTVTNTDSVSRRVRRNKKKALGVQTEETSADCHCTQEEAKVEGTGDRAREVAVLGSCPTLAEDKPKESETSQTEITSLRRKRSVKRRSRCIQANLSLEDQNEAMLNQESSNLMFAPSVPTDVEVLNCNVDPQRNESERVQPETQARKNENESGNGTLSSSIRRMKKVRKTVATTQTEENVMPEDDLFIPPTFQPDSISIRTSSLRRIRRAQKATVSVQTDDVIPVCFENLHLSLMDFKGEQPIADSLGPPRHSDSLIYMNIPAALLEVVESGNDADVSDSEEGENDGEDRDSDDGDFRIYSKVTEEGNFDDESHVITRLSPGDVTVKVSSRRSSCTESSKGHNESAFLLHYESDGKEEDGIIQGNESEGEDESADDKAKDVFHEDSEEQSDRKVNETDNEEDNPVLDTHDRDFEDSESHVDNDGNDDDDDKDETADNDEADDDDEDDSDKDDNNNENDHYGEGDDNDEDEYGQETSDNENAFTDSYAEEERDDTEDVEEEEKEYKNQRPKLEHVDSCTQTVDDDDWSATEEEKREKVSQEEGQHKESDEVEQHNDAEEEENVEDVEKGQGKSISKRESIEEERNDNGNDNERNYGDRKSEDEDSDNDKNKEEARNGTTGSKQHLKRENSLEHEKEGDKGKTNERRKSEISWRQSIARDGCKTEIPKDGWMWQQVNDEEVESNGRRENEVAQEMETKEQREEEREDQDSNGMNKQKEEKPDIIKELKVDKEIYKEVRDDEMNKTYETDETKEDEAIKKNCIKDRQNIAKEEKEVEEVNEERTREKVKERLEDGEIRRIKGEEEGINRKEGNESIREKNGDIEGENRKGKVIERAQAGEDKIFKIKSEKKPREEDKERKKAKEEGKISAEERYNALKREAKGMENDGGKRESRGRERRVFTPRQKFSEKRSRHERGDFSLVDDAQVAITEPAASSEPVSTEESAVRNLTPTKSGRPSGQKPVTKDMKLDKKKVSSSDPPTVLLAKADAESKPQIATGNAIDIEENPMAMRGEEVAPIANFSEPETEAKTADSEIKPLPQKELERKTKSENREDEGTIAKVEVEKEIQTQMGIEEGRTKREPKFEGMAASLTTKEDTVSTKEEDEKENEEMAHKKDLEASNEYEKIESCVVDNEEREQLEMTENEDTRDILPGEEEKETAAEPEDRAGELEMSSRGRQENDSAPLKLTEATRDTFAEDDEECIVITYRPPLKQVKMGRPGQDAGVRGEADGADWSPEPSGRTDERKEQADDEKDMGSKEREEAKRKKTRRSKRKKAKEDVDTEKKEGEEKHMVDEGKVVLKDEDKKKKKRPRQRKNKNEKEKVSQRDLKEDCKSEIQEGHRSQENPTGRERTTADQEPQFAARPPTRQWAEEIDEEGLGEWGEEEKGETNKWKEEEGNEDGTSNYDMSESGSSIGRVRERNPTSQLKAGEHGPSLAVEEDVILTESDALEEEEDTSYYEEEGEGSSRYEMESEEGGEGGGEQNAFEEYLLLREGEGLDEMQTVDRIFKQVFEDYNDGEFLGEGEVSEGECDDSFHFLGNGRERVEGAEGRTKSLTGLRVEGDGCPPPPPPSLTPPPCLITPPPPPPHSPVTPRKGRGAELKVSDPKEKRVKSSELEVESKNDLDVQSSRTSVPPGAEVMQEKLKRSSMRTQATQTDAGSGRKSLPTLALSPRSEKAEMVSQGAQTNGNGVRRKLIKSFSEAAHYEGLEYEIYDLDDFIEPPLPSRAASEGPPPCPPRFSPYDDIPLEDGPAPPPPLKFRQNYHEIFIDSSPRKPRRRLQKTLSEGEILSERRRALSMASGYLEVDINGFTGNEEEVIEPQCVDECSRDLSRSRIFSHPSLLEEEEEEFHENMFHKEILPTSLSPERKMSQVSTDSDLKTFDPNEFRTEEHLLSQLATLSSDSLGEGGTPMFESGDIPEGLIMRDGSPLLFASISNDLVSPGEFGDHLEESMSESQVTVVQRALVASSQVITSDSENGSFHLTDHSSAATTPSTRHKSLPAAGSFEEDMEDELPRLRVSSKVHSVTTLSSIEDEPTSISENVISEGSHDVVSTSTTSSEVDKAIASSTDSDFTSIRSGDSMTIKSEALEEEEFEGDIVIEENIMARLVQGMRAGDVPHQFIIKSSDFRDDLRKLASPESDSSSSHFTEQETSRSPVSGTTNTITSKSDLSRTDSHQTDQSETSEDYITATENSMNGQEARRSYYYEERHVSSPPEMDDIYEDEALTPKILSPEASEVLGDLLETQEISDITEGLSVTSDFETAQDLTSPDGDTTTSASYYIDHSIGEESEKLFPEVKAKPEIPPKPTFLPKPEVPPKPERLSPARETSAQVEELEDETPQDETPPQFPEIQVEITVKRREKPVEESKTGAIKKRYSGGGKVAKDDNRRYSKYFEDNDQGELSEVKGQNQQSWSEEEREKAKQTMKLDFPPGVTMFGEAPSWPVPDSLKTGEVEKKMKVFDKPKKSVKIDLASVEDLQSKSKPESPQAKDKGSETKQVPAKYDKTKRKSDEITPQGMVRSPAMHEGFRLEDWTPVRTPGTPERALDFDTSDESCSDLPRHPPKARSPGKRAKEATGKKFGSPSADSDLTVKQAGEKQSPGKTKESSKDYEELRGSPPKQVRQSPGKTEIKQTSPMRETVTSRTEISRMHSQEVHLRHPSTGIHTSSDPKKRLSEISIGSTPEVTDVQKRHSAEILTRTVESQDHLKPKGPVTGYLRAGSQSPTSRERPLQLPENKLLTIAPLKDARKSAESLRSLSPGSDNVFLSGSREQLEEDSRASLCVQCGERPASREGTLRPSPPSGHTITVERRLSDREPTRTRGVSHRAKSEERNSFSRDWGVTPISLEVGDAPRHDSDDDEMGVYMDAYRSFSWVYVAPHEEAKVWQRDEGRPTSGSPDLRIPGFEDSAEQPGKPEDETQADSEATQALDERGRRGSSDSTGSEQEFRRKYQAITHRMVHRKASVEMYKRLIQAAFQSDKAVTVSRESGEFGFRIHGSRPVVVSAIEADTPAETCGLEVGDIIISINSTNVLDASHSDVVRLAHAGCDTLRLEVARTCDVLTPLVTPDPTPLCAGYLYKLGGARHSPGASGVSRTWHRRWFALKKDHCLYYYKSETEQHPLGAVHLLDYSVHALADVGKPFSFTVAKFGGVTLHLAAHTDDARNRWGQVITQAAAQASQRDELLEVSARRVQQAPSAIASPDCFGFLHKLGARWHQWKRRYCVLKDACLYLYHDTEANQAIGVVYLHGYRVQSTSIGGKRHAFELLPPEPKFRHFYFYTESDSDKKRWLAALEYSIDRWIKVG
ncbi:uncharacterized protein LOC122254395 isoform X2 [Penaeus japonicus]|nr:uncharacterized protein LOC122254395 isoform X2 [Penaeus japonicus]XP_042873998.1 uncharacterized protein LOC122254395 isoform X2 [Penaeus japonicus]